MNSVFLLCVVDEDGDIRELVSAHPTKRSADDAERFYRQTSWKRGEGETEVREVEFGA